MPSSDAVILLDPDLFFDKKNIKIRGKKERALISAPRSALAACGLWLFGRLFPLASCCCFLAASEAVCAGCVGPFLSSFQHNTSYYVVQHHNIYNYIARQRRCTINCSIGSEGRTILR